MHGARRSPVPDEFDGWGHAPVPERQPAPGSAHPGSQSNDFRRRFNDTGKGQLLVFLRGG